MGAPSIEWNAEEIAELERLWQSGMKTAEIGRAMGITKSAVVGKAHRMNLQGRPSPIKRNGDTVKSASRPNVKRSTLPPLVSAMPAVVVDIPSSPAPTPTAQQPVLVESVPATVFKPRRKTPCCWPIGTPGTKSYRVCEDDSLPGKPYCDSHCALAYVKTRDRREDAA